MINRDEVMERVGAENFGQVVEAFATMTETAILHELNKMFPQDENKTLATAIREEIDKYFFDE